MQLTTRLEGNNDGATHKLYSPLRKHSMLSSTLNAKYYLQHSGRKSELPWTSIEVQPMLISTYASRVYAHAKPDLQKQHALFT